MLCCLRPQGCASGAAASAFVPSGQCPLEEPKYGVLEDRTTSKNDGEMNQEPLARKTGKIGEDRGGWGGGEKGEK